MTGAPLPHSCPFWAALQRFAVRRRDRATVEAAIRLRDEHVANDAEREAFAEADRELHARDPGTTATATETDRVTLCRHRVRLRDRGTLSANSVTGGHMEAIPSASRMPANKGRRYPSTSGASKSLARRATDARRYIADLPPSRHCD
jgi:hypothetical protein